MLLCSSLWPRGPQISFWEWGNGALGEGTSAGPKSGKAAGHPRPRPGAADPPDPAQRPLLGRLDISKVPEGSQVLLNPVIYFTFPAHALPGYMIFFKKNILLKEGVSQCIVCRFYAVTLKFYKPSLNYTIEIIFILFSGYATEQYFVPLRRHRVVPWER